MTVNELIEMLEEMPEDAEVRLAIQPSWPFQHDIDTVALDEGHEHSPSDLMSGDGTWYCEDPKGECDMEWDEEPTEEELEAEKSGKPIVYIAEGGQNSDAPYLPGSAKKVIGW